MAHGGADAQGTIPAGVYRPSAETAAWSLAVTTGWVVLAVVLRDAALLFPGAMFLTLWLQCRQRLVVEGREVVRLGLHPVVLDLATAEVVCRGARWWQELFLLGRSLQLRDADGHRLYLESWLWDAATRATFVEALAEDARS